MSAIPKIIHHGWFSDTPLPDDLVELRLSWLRNNPDYTFRLWSTKTLLELELLPSVRDLLVNGNLHYVMKSDLGRWEVLRIFGGIYSDTDVRCLRNFDELLKNTKNKCFAGKSYAPNGMGNAVVGAYPGHLLMKRLSSMTAAIIKGHRAVNISDMQVECDIVNLAGKLLAEADCIYPVTHFYPYSWYSVTHCRGQSFPDSFTEHLWHGIDKGWTKDIKR